MTPLWRKFVKGWIRHRDPALRAKAEALLSAHCFDMTSVRELIMDTGHELLGGENPRFAATALNTEIDLGERTVVPSDHVWIETRNDGGGLGYRLLRSGADKYDLFQYIQFCGDMLESAENQNGDYAGAIYDLGNGMFRLNAPSDYDHYMLSHCLAAVAIINAPSAERHPVQAHRGLEREITKVSSVRPPATAPRATTILIGPGRKAAGTAGAEHHSSPKAYHFCRAHTRQKQGRVERVRAHWRGDAAYGIRIGGYRARSPQPAYYLATPSAATN